MNKTFKLLISIIVSIIGLSMYFLTYILVPFTLENEVLKYIIMIIGYIGVIIFPFGFYNLVKEIRDRKTKNNQNK